MITCPNKNLPEWLELERVIPELAYTIWDNNNGYGIDKAPNGEPSKLFSDLLEHFGGDRDATIQAKAKVYSTAFKSWFGDWVNNPTESSKVVDENGEPLVVYHGTSSRNNFSEFKPSSVSTPWYSRNVGIFFSSDKNYSESNYGSLYDGLYGIKAKVYSAFLNIKTPFTISELSKGLSTDIADEIRLSTENETPFNYGTDGIIGHDIKIDGLTESNGIEYVVYNSNQIKSIDNQGTFDDSNNIYNRIDYNDEINPSSDATKERNQSITMFTNTNLLINYINGLDNISDYTKDLLSKLSIVLADLDIITRPIDKGVASYIGGTVLLNNNRLRYASNQLLAEDVAHEMLHHYFKKLYDTDADFKEAIDNIKLEFKKVLGDEANEWYGFRDKDKSDEALNELIANNSLRYTILKNLEGRTLWLRFILLLTKFLTGKDITNLDSLTSEVSRLIDRVNIGDIETYTNGQFNQLVFKEDLNLSDSDKLLTKITKGLLQRYESIKRYTKRNIRTENELSSLILKLSTADTTQGVVEFIDHINDSIDDSIKFLNKPMEDINYKLIRQLNEDYVGFYKPLLDLIKYNLDTTDMFKDIEDLDSFKNLVNNLSSEMDTVNNKFRYVAKNKGILLITEKLLAINAPLWYIDKAIAYMTNPNNDGNFFNLWLGMSSNSSNPLVSTIAKMLNDTKNKTDRYVYLEGLSMLDVLANAKVKHGDKVLELLYEKDRDGNYTGYMVRDINHGLFHSDFKMALNTTAKSLDIKLDSDGNYILPEDDEAINKWYNSINDFYSKNAERRYTVDYYKLRNQYLSNDAKSALDEVNSAINQILDSVPADDITIVNQLTKELSERLESLRRKKKFLSVEYNLDGTPKEGIEGKIAKELRTFHDKVSIDNIYIPDTVKFQLDEKKVIAKYGKNSNEYKSWYEANTVKRYTLEFYDRIAALDHIELSDLYNDLADKRRLILSIYRDSKSLLIDSHMMSDKEKSMIRELDLDISNLYQPAENSQDDEADRFSKFAEVTYTELYYNDYKAALAAGLIVFDQWFEDNHYENYKGLMKPASYYMRLTPKMDFVDLYTETVPYGKYTKLDSSSKYYNSNFIEGGLSILPKKSIYNNSKQYSTITNSPELQSLYNMIHSSMLKYNKLLSFILDTDSYKMPQISAKTLVAISRQNGVLDALKYVLADVAVTKEDDTDYVDEFATKPNGKPLRMIPTRYIKMLLNTNNISTDAVASVLLYANMAANFYNMSELRDLIELLLNTLEDTEISTRTGFKGKGSTIYYQLALLLVDRVMYGREKTPIKLDAFGKEINVSKALDITRDWVSKVNLSYNPWSIGTSLLTDISYTTLESTLGRYFTGNDLRFAISEFLSLLPYILSNTGNPKPNNKITYLMQLNLIVRDNHEIYDRLYNSTTGRALNLNFWFAGYTQADYTVKGHTTVAIYHSYKLVDGQGFMSKTEYINKFYKDNRKAGEIAFKLLPINLYDAYTQVGNEYQVDKKYAKYINEKLLNDVKNRIDILTRRIDGTLRDIDKAKVHTNAVTAYITQHRNFMISGLHDRFKSKNFNQDLGVEEEGYYRTMGRFLKNIIGTKHFALSSILADYDNLLEYELYSIRRVLSELTMVTSSTLVALSLASLVDGDDDYDNWLMLATTYLALRSAFEFRTMYNPMELMSMIKSPTAAFSWFDNSLGILGILNPFSYIYAKSPFSTVDRGVYKNLPRILKTLIKISPAKNIMEALDPKTKRNYLLNLLMSF